MGKKSYRTAIAWYLKAAGKNDDKALLPWVVSMVRVNGNAVDMLGNISFPGGVRFSQSES
jgi:hypothetical protein